MTTAFRFLTPINRGAPIFRRAWLVLLAMLLSGLCPVAAQTPNPPSDDDDPNFPQYLVDHQSDLEPFFELHRDDLIKEVLPLFLKIIAIAIILNLVVGWAFDAGLALAFSYYFAPAYTGLRRALTYATVRLGLAGGIAVIAGLTLVGLSQLGGLAVALALPLFGLLDFIAQSILVSLIYKTRAVISILFYVTLFIVHVLVSSLLLAPMLKAQVTTMTTQFIDQNVSQQMTAYTSEDKRTLRLAQEERDKAKESVAAATSQLSQAEAEEKRLAEEIERRKNSEEFVFGRIVQLHAQGKLIEAQKMLTDFLQRFPNGAYKDRATAQLGMVESELAVQEAQRKQKEADDAAAAAAYRADLLARAAKGEVTLSEMRAYLIGKTRADVNDLLGKPDETASDKWGYARLMIINNFSGEHYGLTVVFAQGTVQGVDYYYGHKTGGME